MFKLNSIFQECFDPYKIIWNWKKHLSDKDWIYLCGDCIGYYKYLNGKNFNSQLQNIYAIIKCRLNSTKIVLTFYEVK